MQKVAFIFIVCFFSEILLSKVAYSGAVQTTNFTDVSQSAGVDVIQQSYGNPLWGDIDNDGYIDVFMSNHAQRTPSLFRNNTDETFTDIVIGSGMDFSRDRHGSAFGDYDNDGDLDIFVSVGAESGITVGEKQDMLFQNNGNGNFTDVTVVAGVTNAFGRGRSVNWLDYDNDGYLDLFVMNFLTPNVLYHNSGDGTFLETSSLSGLANGKGKVSTWADYDKDGDMDLLIPHPIQLWSNNGDGTFTDVTSLSGLVGDDSPLSGAAWGDYNNDGNIDLYLARGEYDLYRFFWDTSIIVFSDSEKVEDGLDFITSGNVVSFDLYVQSCHPVNLVFIGKDKKPPLDIPFTLTKEEALGQPSYIPGQDEGFFVWYDDSGWHIRWSNDSSTESKYFYGKITNSDQFTSVRSVSLEEIPEYPYSKLYKNNGNGIFTDVTSNAGISVQANSHSAVFGDYDNDGYLDIYIVNSGSHQGNGDNVLYRNNGDDTFADVTNEVGVAANVSGRGDGAAWGDFDNDGFLDLYVTNGYGRPIPSTEKLRDCLSSGPSVLYKNNGNENRWLKINLVGTISNRNGIGTKAILQANGLTQFRELSGGGGGQHSSQGFGPIHFGLGQADLVDSLTLQWPSGIVQIFNQIPANLELTIIEADQNPQQLVSHWEFNEGGGNVAADSTDNGNDGTVQGTAVWSTGKIGGALSFDGIDDYVLIPAINNQELTISAWIFKNSVEVDIKGDSIFGGFRWDVDDQLREGFKLEFHKDNPDKIGFILVTEDMQGTRTQKWAGYDFGQGNSVGNWYHVTGTYNRTSGEQKFYLDGALVKTVAHPPGNTIVPLTSIPNMRIGGVAGAASFGFIEGIIDDVRVYNKALSDAEIVNLYLLSSVGPVAYWKFDDASGNVASDSSGNGNDGTVQGGAVWSTGKIDGALSFDGTDDNVSVPAINNQELTISAWIFKNSVDIKGDSIFGGFRWDVDDQLREGFKLEFHKDNPDKIGFILVTEDMQGTRTQKWAGYDFGQGNSVGNWYHVTGTYNRTSGEQKFYLDGTLVKTVAHPPGNTIVPLTSISNMRIGGSAGVGSGNIDGIIDAVRLYSREISAKEVLDLYNSL